MRIVNPLQYPLAILAGAIILVVGIRLIRFSQPIVIVISIVVSYLIATLIESLKSKNPALKREIQATKQQAQLLAQQAKNLRMEAEELLINANQLELLTTIQYACDRAKEMPIKVKNIIDRLQDKNSLLSPSDIQRQLGRVKAKQSKSSGEIYEQLEQLARSLERNLELARQGQDTSQAQIFSLSSQIIDAAGVLQKLQNKIRTSNLNDTENLHELNDLSKELNNIQENVDFLNS